MERLQLTEGESQPQLKELKQQQPLAAYDGGGGGGGGGAGLLVPAVTSTVASPLSQFAHHFWPATSKALSSSEQYGRQVRRRFRRRVGDGPTSAASDRTADSSTNPTALVTKTRWLPATCSPLSSRQHVVHQRCLST